MTFDEWWEETHDLDTGKQTAQAAWQASREAALIEAADVVNECQKYRQEALCRTLKYGGDLISAPLSELRKNILALAEKEQ